jgi:hypothetical protein
LPQAENHRNGKLMSRCAETVEDENCLWKQMEKRKTILLGFFELLSILSLVTFVRECAPSTLKIPHIFLRKVSGLDERISSLQVPSND